MSRYIRDYETLDEIERQLYRTIIMYDGKLVLVTEVRQDINDLAENSFRLYLKDFEGKQKIVDWKKDKDKFNLAPLEPMYVYHKDVGAIWCVRVAKRMWQQGATSGNTATWAEPGGGNQGFGGENLLDLLHNGLVNPVENKGTVEFLKNLKQTYANQGYIRSHVLNSNLACSYHSENDFQIHFRGQVLGKVTLHETGEIVYVSENNSSSLNPWCRKALEKAGL